MSNAACKRDNMRSELNEEKELSRKCSGSSNGGTCPYDYDILEWDAKKNAERAFPPFIRRKSGARKI